MVVVLDTGFFINKNEDFANIDKAYITTSVAKEIKDEFSREYASFYAFRIEIRDPKPAYVNMIEKQIKDKNYGLSQTDIDVVALTYELSDEISNIWIGPENKNDDLEVKCITYDNGIKQALMFFGLCGGATFRERIFKGRCYACFNISDTVTDFCKKCGLQTVKRVSMGINENGEEFPYLKKNFKYTEVKTLKDNIGNELKSADQREYIQYQKVLNKKIKKEKYLKAKEGGFFGL